MFSPVVTEFWRAPFVDGTVLHQDDTFTLISNPGLDDNRRVTILTTVDGQVTAALTPALAESLDQRGKSSQESFRAALAAAGVALADPDCLFYFTQAATAELLNEDVQNGPRRLTAQDAAVFAAFEAAASEQDLDDAYVELDHWAVYGGFEGDSLVCAASMYPWGGAAIADTGVLTLPQFRGRGHARAVVRAICRYAYGQNHEPQYRCQLDNHASRAVAAAAGLTQLGTWEVVSPTAAN